MRDKLCLGHLPVVEIIPVGDDGILLPESALLREELFALHRDVSFISSTGTNTESALTEDWPQNPNTALPTGAERLPTCPKEVDSSAGEILLLHIRVHVISSRCKITTQTC